MSNYDFKNDKITFKTNGNDKLTNVILIFLVLLIAAMTIVMGAILLSINFIQNNPILGGIILLVFFIGLIFLVVILAKTGIFARYYIEILSDKIKVYDKRLKRDILTEKTNKEYFYLADTREQIGYMSVKLKGLCYGKTKQIFVQDRPPSKDFILLCIGKIKPITELLNKIRSRVS